MHWKRHWPGAAALALCAAALAAGAGTLHTGIIDPQRYLADVKYLASPELKGRGTGTPGLEKAAAYIERQFRDAGLRPADGNNYFQPFPVTMNARLGPKNRFEYTEHGRRTALKVSEDFVPFNFSSSGAVSGRLVFAGYGITAPEYGYDDYAGIDVKGKIVVVLRHEPQEFDEKSVFAGKMLTEHAHFWSKALNARRHGAAAVLLINDRVHHGGYADELARFARTVGPAEAGIPFAQVRADIAEDWIAAAGVKLGSVEEKIDRELRPDSFALPAAVKVQLSIEVDRDHKTVRNVTGYLPGDTPEYVIVGAHYDHIGLGEQYSMAPARAGTPHPGADDNASGTAGVLELARWFAGQPRHKRGVLFLAFAGEELGLLGSRYYVDHPKLTLDNAVAMLNLDMIGRIRKRRVYVGGVRTGSSLRAVLDDAFARQRLEWDSSGEAETGASDHQAFVTRRVPVLFFFSGLHPDYHTPDDTWDKVDAPDAADLLRAVARIAVSLCDAAARPAFVRVDDSSEATAGST